MSRCVMSARRMMVVWMMAMAMVGLMAADSPGSPLEELSKPANIVQPHFVAEAPFAAQAGMVVGDLLYLARMTEDGLEVTSATLATIHREWNLQRSVPDVATTGRPDWGGVTVPGSMLPNAGRVFAADGQWYLAGAPGNLLVVPANPQELVEGRTRPLEVAVPVRRIDALVVKDGLLTILGFEGDLTIVATRVESLGPEVQWAKTEAVPNALEGAALGVAGDFLYVIGGQAILGGQRRTLTDVVRAQRGADGRLSVFSRLIQRLQLRHEMLSAASLNDLIAVLGQVSDEDGNTTRTLSITSLRSGSNNIDFWREMQYAGIPRHGAIIFGHEDSHTLLVVGGADRNGPITTIEGLFPPMTSVLNVRGRDEFAESQFARHQLPFYEFETGLVRARSEAKYHVALLVEDARGQESERALSFDRNMRGQLQEVVLSRPRASARETILQETGIAQLPALVLYNPEGQVVATHPGMPNPQSLHNFLRPIWGPQVR